MFNFGDLQKTKSKIKVHRNKSLKLFNLLVQEAINLYEYGLLKKDQDSLKLASEKFYNAIEIKRTDVKPFAYLSSIYYLFEMDDIADQYFFEAKDIDESFPLLFEIKTKMIDNLYR